MVFYYKLEDAELEEHVNQNIENEEVALYCNLSANSNLEPMIHYDFSKYVLIEFLDDFTSAKSLWESLGLTKNKAVVRKRLTIDPHRLKCRRAILICTSHASAKLIVNNLKGKIINERKICAVVIEDLLADIRLFEKQIKKYGDLKAQEKLVYVSNLNKFRKPATLVKFLNDKFSPFGTICSVLVSANADGYALGEAVIRFSYFSEAFAAELAYDECVLGKEKLNVVMQHNVLLCECDLRVRLKDGLKAYQNKIGIGPLFRPSINSTKSSLGTEPKVSLPNVIAFKSNTAGERSTHTSSNVSPNASSFQVNPLSQNSVELVREMCVNLCEGKSSLNTSNVIPIPDIEIFNKNENSSECYKGSHIRTTCAHDSLTACKNNELLADNSLENSNQSWSSRILGWVRSFVANEPLLLEENMSNLSLNLLNKECSQSQNDNDGKRKEIDSVPYVLLTSISNLSEENILKPTPTSMEEIEVNQISACNDLADNKGHTHQDSSEFHNDVENCSPSKNRKISKFTFGQQLTNKGEDYFEKDLLFCHNTKEANRNKTKNRTNSSKPSFNNDYSIVTRSRKKHSTLALSNESNQNEEDSVTTVNLRVNGLTGCSKHQLKNKNKSQTNFCYNTNNFDKVGINILNSKPTIASNFYAQERSCDAQEHTILTQSSSVSSLITKTVSHADDHSHIMHTYSTLDSSHKSNITCQTILKSTDSVSSIELCFEEMYKNSSAESYTSQRSILGNTSKQKNIPLGYVNQTHASLSPAVIFYRQHQNSIPLSNRNELDNSTESSSSSFDSPIRTWLKHHLLCSVNNRVTTDEDNPEGIVFATMSKDILISVGCSHMTCDVCYPGASNLIFGF